MASIKNNGPPLFASLRLCVLKKCLQRTLNVRQAQRLSWRPKGAKLFENRWHALYVKQRGHGDATWLRVSESDKRKPISETT